MNAFKLAVIAACLTTPLLFSACTVDTFSEIKDIRPTVSLVQTGTGSVMLKPSDVEIDKENKLVKKIFGVAYAGYAANDSFTAAVALDFANPPAGYDAFSKDECYISSDTTGKGNSAQVTVAAGELHAPFYLVITKAAIDRHPGRKLAVHLKISGVSKYTLSNNAAADVLVDINDFGTVKQEVTDSYLKNPVFDRAPGTTARFCNLADWLANPAVTQSRPTGAGYDANVRKMGIERWGSYDNPILNGKIYQSFTLPKGNYVFELQMASVIPDRDTYFTVTDKDTLPDDRDIASSLAFKAITADYNNALLTLPLQLPASQKITVGFLLNFDQGVQKVLQATNIKLYKTASLFD
jgi:hypothetical protein